MISKVITDIEAFNLPKLAELLKYILIKILKVLLDPAGINGLPLGIHSRRDHVRPLVHVGKQQSGRDCGPIVEPGTAIPVTASSNLEIERAVNPVLLRTKNGSQVLRHRCPSTDTVESFAPLSKLCVQNTNKMLGFPNGRAEAPQKICGTNLPMINALGNPEALKTLGTLTVKKKAEFCF